MKTEEWRPVPGWPGYEVSDLGRVLSRRRRTPRLLRPSTTRHGYQRVSLSVVTREKGFLVHQLVLSAFAGPCPKGKETRHLDGDPSNNRLSNLAYGTARENGRDRAWHRRNPGTVRPDGHEMEETDVIPTPQGMSPEAARHWVIGASLVQLDELEQQWPGEGERAREVLLDQLQRWEPLGSKAVAS